MAGNDCVNLFLYNTVAFAPYQHDTFHLKGGVVNSKFRLLARGVSTN